MGYKLPKIPKIPMYKMKKFRVDGPVPNPYVDLSKIENQIDCGYCIHEADCKMRDPKINKAKAGCPMWKHFTKK